MGNIISVVEVASGQPHNLNEFYTIDSFFESLQQGLISDPGENTAEFDPQYGYPVRVRFDEPLLFADDITYGLSGFRVVPEPATIGMALVGCGAIALRRGKRTRGDAKDLPSNFG
jgi:hypothetical protein